MYFLITDTGMYYQGHMLSDTTHLAKYGYGRRTRERRTYFAHDVVDSGVAEYAMEMYRSGLEDLCADTAFMDEYGGMYLLVCPD